LLSTESILGGHSFLSCVCFIGIVNFEISKASGNLT
jgi:hypothetical protein